MTHWVGFGWFLALRKDSIHVNSIFTLRTALETSFWHCLTGSVPPLAGAAGLHHPESERLPAFSLSCKVFRALAMKPLGADNEKNNQWSSFRWWDDNDDDDDDDYALLTTMSMMKVMIVASAGDDFTLWAFDLVLCQSSIEVSIALVRLYKVCRQAEVPISMQNFMALLFMLKIKESTAIISRTSPLHTPHTSQHERWW